MAFWAVDIRERLAQLADTQNNIRDGGLIALGIRRPDLAAQCLEQGRAAFWAHGLRLRQGFDSLPHEIRDEVMRLSHSSLEVASFVRARDTSMHKATPEEAQFEALKLRQSARFDELLDKAQSLPGRNAYIPCIATELTLDRVRTVHDRSRVPRNVCGGDSRKRADYNSAPRHRGLSCHRYQI